MIIVYYYINIINLETLACDQPSGAYLRYVIPVLCIDIILKVRSIFTVIFTHFILKKKHHLYLKSRRLCQKYKITTIILN